MESKVFWMQNVLGISGFGIVPLLFNIYMNLLGKVIWCHCVSYHQLIILNRISSPAMLLRNWVILEMWIISQQTNVLQHMCNLVLLMMQHYYLIPCDYCSFQEHNVPEVYLSMIYWDLHFLPLYTIKNHNQHEDYLKTQMTIF